MTTTGAGPRVRVLPPGVDGERLREIKAKERGEAGLPVETDKERRARIASQNAKRRVKHCSKCGLSGHSKATCDRKRESAAKAVANPLEGGSRAHATGSEVGPVPVRRRAPGSHKPQACKLCGEAGHNATTCKRRGKPGKGETRRTSAGPSVPRAPARPSSMAKRGKRATDLANAEPEPTRALVSAENGGGQLVANGLLNQWVLQIIETALEAELAKVRQMRIEAAR